MDVLVVGANGQLGAACCRRLVAQGHGVRGSVRDRARAVGLGLEGVDLVEADLALDPDLDALLTGVDVVVLSANSAVPRAGDQLDRFDRGVLRLVDAAARLGIERVILPSLPVTAVDERVPLAAARRRLEERVMAAVPGSVVLRFAPFMDCWLALVGSSIPLRGTPNATIGRPSPFLRLFRGGTGQLVEKRGLMLVPGPTAHRQAFISVEDAAAACVAAVSRADVAGRTLDVGGPEILTWDEVAQTFSHLLGRRVRALSTPTPVFAAAAAVLRPVAPVPSRTMALNRFVGTSQSPWPPGGGLVDPEAMTTVRQFLSAKLALPSTLPTVA